MLLDQHHASLCCHNITRPQEKIAAKIVFFVFPANPLEPAEIRQKKHSFARGREFNGTSRGGVGVRLDSGVMGRYNNSVLVSKGYWCKDARC